MLGSVPVAPIQFQRRRVAPNEVITANCRTSEQELSKFLIRIKVHTCHYTPLAVLKIKDSGTKVETLTSECNMSPAYMSQNSKRACFME